MKRAICVIMVFAFFMLYSCSFTPRNGNSRVKDAPRAENLPSESAGCSFTANLYSASNDGYISEAAVIETYGVTSPLNALINAVLSKSGIHVPGLSLRYAVAADDVCIVDFGGPFPDDIEDWILLESLILFTVNDFCSCRSICMLSDGKMPAYNGFPLGAGLMGEYTPDEYVAQRLSALSSDDAASVQIEYVLFVPTNDSPYLNASAVRDFYQKDADGISDVIKKTLSVYSAYFTKHFGRTIDTGISNALICEVTDDDIVSIRVETSKGIYTSPELLIKALYLTLLCSTPDCFGRDKLPVEITVNAQNTDLSDTENCMKAIGASFDAYYPFRSESTLERTKVFISAYDRYSPKELLSRMLDVENAAKALIPNDLSSEISFEYCADNTAVISMTAKARKSVIDNFINNVNFYDSRETRERLFIYSIVNTLVRLPQIDSVFFTDSETRQPSGDILNIFLGSPLYENPGLNVD